MIYRSFGNTNRNISAIGFGRPITFGLPQARTKGSHHPQCDRPRHTFMDNCWDYHNGESERRMGLALGDGYRKESVPDDQIRWPDEGLHGPPDR